MAEPNNRDDLTAARQHAPPTFRRPWPKDHTIDCHSHAFVPAAATVAASHLRTDPRAPQYSQDTTVLARKQDADRAPNLVDVALRLRDFDGMGVGAQIISPAPNQSYYDVPAAIGI